MRRRILILNFLCFSLLFGLPFISMAQDSERQTIVDPLTLSGTVGTRVTSSWNNADLHYDSPFSATAYADIQSIWHQHADKHQLHQHKRRTIQLLQTDFYDEL